MIITKSPLRVSLFGGGTDFRDYWKYNSGSVISIAINKYVYILIKKRLNQEIYLHWKKREVVKDINKIKHELVRESLKKTNLKKNLDIVCLSDVSELGSGLGSSSSFTAALLKCCNDFKNKNISKKKLVSDTLDIELNKLKKPIGYQDQYITVYGGFKRFYFQKNGNVKIFNYKLDKIKSLIDNLFLVPTNVYRSAELVLNEQNKKIKLNKTHLDQISEITNEAHKYIISEDFNKIGYLLNDYWKIKKQLSSNVSNDVIDKIYKRGILSGSLGGKICGAGNRGFLLFYVPKKNKKNFQLKMKNFNFFQFDISNKGTYNCFDDFNNIKY